MAEIDKNDQMNRHNNGGKIDLNLKKSGGEGRGEGDQHGDTYLEKKQIHRTQIC